MMEMSFIIEDFEKPIMHQKILAEKIFYRDYEWHSGYFHFDFGDYHDPDNQDFGVLTALNDFIVQPNSGFETHPHSEMEIISYCVKGRLTHKDSLSEENLLVQGDSQYTCTGSGITHSELNKHADNPLRFLQIWIKPIASGLQPLYKIKKIQPEEDNERIRHIVSGENLAGVMQIAQDANVYVGHLKKGQHIRYKNYNDRQSYIYCLEGEMHLNGYELMDHDAMKITEFEEMQFESRDHAHFVIVEMARSL